MARIHYFNPDNDLALAFGGPNYTPTPRAIGMRRDLRLLAAWMAADGDAVLVEDSRDREWLRQRLPAVGIITPDRLPALERATYLPWGWSLAVRHRLANLGANPSDLPSIDQIATIRQLSHRRTGISFHRQYTELAGSVACLPPTELLTVDEVAAYAERNPGCFLKQPWSGSGRGIYRAYDPAETRMRQWVGGVIRRQGSILAEPALDAVLDCASEWVCRNGKACLTGFSVFHTDRHNQFIGTRVAPTGELHSIITSLYPDFDSATERQQAVLNQLVAPRYEGPLGIDMLLFRTGNAIRLNPCIEINLRCTMGHLAIALAGRGMRGMLRIISADSISAADTPITPACDTAQLAAVVTR